LSHLKITNLDPRTFHDDFWPGPSSPNPGSLTPYQEFRGTRHVLAEKAKSSQSWR